MTHTRLAVGIIERETAWSRVLEQIGVATEHVADLSTLSPATHSVLIVNRTLDDMALKAIEAYVTAGGNVLDTGPLVSRLDRTALRSRWFGTISPAPAERAFAGVGLADIELRLRVHRDATYLHGLLALLPLGKGAIFHLPLPLSRLLLDTSARRRGFPAQTPRPPNERVARIAKGEIRRIVDAVLRMAHFRSGLPYIHRRWLPGAAQGVLCYRIDSDSGSREQILALHEAAQAHHTRLTWFLHTEAHEGWLDLFTTFARDELALHGYRHATYDTLEENLVNQSEALRLLNDAGIQPDGLAAPYGIWNPAVAHTVARLGLNYSSEFALDYDDLPFHPIIDGRETRALQLPIHPICIGSLRIAHASSETMKLYFRRVIDKTVARREPTLLYHHPTHEHIGVMEDTLAYARTCEVTSWTMGELAEWWRRREATAYSAWYGNNQITVVPRACAGEDVMIEIERPGEYALLPLNQEQHVVCTSLQWNPMIVPSEGGVIEDQALRRPSLHRAVRTVEHAIHRTQG